MYLRQYNCFLLSSRVQHRVPSQIPEIFSGAGGTYGKLGFEDETDLLEFHKLQIYSENFGVCFSFLVTILRLFS
jgi:hypothetical protein